MDDLRTWSMMKWRILCPEFNTAELGLTPRSTLHVASCLCAVWHGICSIRALLASTSFRSVPNVVCLCLDAQNWFKLCACVRFQLSWNWDCFEYHSKHVWTEIPVSVAPRKDPWEQRGRMIYMVVLNTPAKCLPLLIWHFFVCAWFT